VCAVVFEKGVMESLLYAFLLYMELAFKPGLPSIQLHFSDSKKDQRYGFERLTDEPLHKDESSDWNKALQ
jgi:hypothetical protein